MRKYLLFFGAIVLVGTAAAFFLLRVNLRSEDEVRAFMIKKGVCSQDIAKVEELPGLWIAYCKPPGTNIYFLRKVTPSGHVIDAV